VDSVAIYYFSATGNSLAVALRLAEHLGASSPVSIPGSLVLDDPYVAASTANKVGFVFPVHRATLPEMVRGFINSLPARPDCYYFAVSTYTIFGCNEFWDIDEILRSKGAVLNYASDVRMMGNVGLGQPSSRVIERRFKAMDDQVVEIAEAVSNGQENYFRRAFKLLGSAVRRVNDSRRRHIVFRIDEHCKRCGICAQVCPAQNITLDSEGDRAPVRSSKCEACLACVHWCPANALHANIKLHGHYHNPTISPDQLNPKGVKPLV
jgi:ferredoxin